ncbi:MAG: hypothetical protein HY898_14330 [Deltaproteobacteria bacterium]|nr:hypothetical protein [Deltaproteobacteria bacterium]
MKEREIRDVLDRVCRQLDAVRPARVLPVLAGTALIAGAGCGSESQPLYGAPLVPGPDAGDAEASDDAASADDGPVVKYGAPDADQDADAGAQPPYMAPDSGAQPDYGAPSDGG